jgi:CRISPR-associated exonuclease Cas4
MEPQTEASLVSWGITGTEVHYFALCPRKLWWFSHGIEQEHSGGASGTSTAQENVSLGTLLHEESYKEAGRKDVLIDNLIRLDFTEGGVVHEVKKSRGALGATRMQLRYYLYYLKHEKGIETTGEINFPKERRTETVTLTEEAEVEMAEFLIQLRTTRELPTPPMVEEPMTLCKKCSYQDLCWG